MYLVEVLGQEAAGNIDATRPLNLGPIQLGVEAAEEAARILAGGDFPRDVTCSPRDYSASIYWSLAHQDGGVAEIFGFPEGTVSGLPTAVEVALVRALAAAQPGDHAVILRGGIEVSLGPPEACGEFCKITAIATDPIVGSSILYPGSGQVIVSSNSKELLNQIALQCLSNSFRTSPLKFRFLELYRMMEARFLADVKQKLISGFDAEPNAALTDALAALQSEMSQIMGLAETQQEAFEACWTALDVLKNNNRFATALFRRIEKKKVSSGEKWKTGAALVYQIRCAVVHAGEKDMIFENFSDGEDAIEAVISHVERASLLLVGIKLI